MMNLTRGLQALTKQVNVQTNIEIPSAALTLTRSATLAITTAGTTITWQVVTRNQSFTWSGTDITIPTAGFYAMQASYATTGTVTMLTQIIVNGTRLGYIGYQQVTTNYFQSTYIRYFATGDVIQISALPSANTTITVNADNVLNPSPFLSIVQLTGAV